MRRSVSVAVTAVLVAASACAQAVSVTSAGWTIEANGGEGVLQVRHERLGPVMSDVRLNLRNDARLKAFGSWFVEKSGASGLRIRTADPTTGWLIEARPNALQISSTSMDAVITAALPASKDRIVARTLDPEGAPVNWLGTQEVVGSYGGSETRNASFLPRRNPEVMYFSLGQVSGGNFHSLFDRKSDIAISFTDESVMRRASDNPDVLELTMPVAGNAMVRLTPDYFTKTLGAPFYIPFDDSYFSSAPMVWSSWTSYYEAVREEDIVRNADWLAANLKPYGFQYVQLDDGYDRGKKGEHYWIENWDKQQFPHGPQWLAGYIKSKGLRPGIWLVPNSYAGAVKQHPDWYLQFKTGKTVLDYHTPALDSSNPEVLAFLKHLFGTLDSWGFEYYKFDGEHAIPKYAPGVDKDKLYAKTADPLVVYRDRLKLIREIIGPKRFIEGCPAGTPLNGVGYFQSYFTGDDLYNNWQGMYPLFSSINANAFVNHLLVYVMPGEGLELGLQMTVAEAEKRRPPVVVRTARTREDPMIGFGTTDAEARTLVTYVALTGVAYPLASVMPELPPERVKLLKMTMPTMPILPGDLFSRGTDMRWDKFKHTTPDTYIHNYPEILDVKVNAAAGVYDLAGLTNWRSRPETRNIDLVEKLGLDAGQQYLVFDFWNQKLLGVFKDRMQVEVQPHDTRVLLIHPLLNRPQLVGNSRHISGAYSIREASWDAASKTLRGSSETVPGDGYTLWIHVPDGYSVAGVRASEAGKDVPVRHAQEGNALSLTFEGRQTLVNWEVSFSR